MARSQNDDDVVMQRNGYDEIEYPVVNFNRDSEEDDINKDDDLKGNKSIEEENKENTIKLVPISELPFVPDQKFDSLKERYQSANLSSGTGKLKFQKTLNMIRSKTMKIKKSKNPEKSKGLISKLKQLQSKKFDEFENLDSNSRKRIKLILKLESSYWFYAYNFLAHWLDYYSRIAFPILFVLYLVYMFIKTTQNTVIIAVTVVIECIVVVVIFSSIGA